MDGLLDNSLHRILALRQYTASISEQKKVKLTEEAEELGKLKATLRTIPRKESKRVNQTEEILKMENRRMEQL